MSEEPKLSPVREDAYTYWYQEFRPKFGTVVNHCGMFDCDRSCTREGYCEY